VAQNAAALQQAVGRYAGVADGADLPGAAMSFDPWITERTDALGQAERDTYSDRPQVSAATRLDSDNRPGTPAGTPLQDGR
jgi:hypothetical protein